MMPLTIAAKNQPLLIKKVGGKKEFQKHLQDLGFIAGSTVCVIAETGGNLIVNIKEARVAISREMAMRIMV